MKRIILVAFAIALLASGCKVFKSSKKSDAAAPKTETTAETKVFSVPAPKSTVRENPTSDTMYETADKSVTGKPVSIRSENFTFTTEDQAAYGSKSFFVIVGSFSSSENAGRFKQELVQQGFKPIILHSETGYYRVCVDSFNDETAARSRVQKIRTEFPKYADSWLLIKKK
jgi:cell division protein FtsN